MPLLHSTLSSVQWSSNHINAKSSCIAPPHFPKSPNWSLSCYLQSLQNSPHCILHYQNKNWFKKEWMKETISPVLCEPFQCYELLAHSETLSKTVVITGMQDYKMPPPPPSPPTILIQHSSCSFGNVLSDLSRYKLLPGFKHMPTRWEADSALSQKGISGLG